MSTLRIGAALPTLPESDDDTIPDIGAAARHLEQLGLESVWVADLIIGDGSPTLEAMIALAAAAAMTERVQVGFSVLALPMRPVAWTAAQIMALQHISRNRVLLGVGIGMSSRTPFWQAVGAPTQGRGRSTDAALEVLPQLIAGEPTRLEHEPDRPMITLAPAARMPPVLVGGFRDSDVGLRRAATYGDGWFPSLLTPQNVAAGAAKLREFAAERGRATPSVTLGTHVVLGDDAATRSARDALVRDMIDTHGIPPDEAAGIPVTGTPHQAAERFADYAAAGADRLVIAPTSMDWMEQSELVAEAYDLLAPHDA
jgi:alkanesulfonate monooxygenase SsuD/methylene tetrahydromethanopterin reductase-like flavin-dependent oxidoreductase (luciferase family)